MTEPRHVLRLVEGVARRRAAVLVDPADVTTIGDALELFRTAPEDLVASGALAAEARDDLLEVAGCLFDVDPEGELGRRLEGLRVLRGHEPLADEAPLLFERRALPGGGDVMLAELTIDRRDCTYQRDWAAYHRRAWRLHRDRLEAFLLDAARRVLGPVEAERVLSGRSEADRGRVLRAAAERIYEAPFELYSRFVGRGHLIKDGAATILNVLDGHGGACSEKAQAVRLVADTLGLEAEYVLSGPGASGEVPEAALLEILDSFDVKYSRAVQTYWNHVAVLARVEGEEVLVDATNGNLPFLWVRGEPLAAMLDARGEERRAVRHRYVVAADELYYNRVDQIVPERLLYALELGWADPHIDLVQLLDDELGLLGAAELWLGVVPYRDEDERRTVETWYRERWLERGEVSDLLFAEDFAAVDGPLARRLRERYPGAARAAVDGRRLIEQRLEEANPGEGYRIELVLAGRLDEGEVGS